jgi:hypothetical protein
MVAKVEKNHSEKPLRKLFTFRRQKADFVRPHLILYVAKLAKTPFRFFLEIG